MVSIQQARTGNRVYNGVSQSPNRGQVSAKGAQGYIQREIRKKQVAGPVRQVGGDGQSDSRSAVAAQALRRRGGGKSPKGTKKGSGPRPIVPKGPKGPKTGGPRPPIGGYPPGYDPNNPGAGGIKHPTPPIIKINGDGT